MENFMNDNDKKDLVEFKYYSIGLYFGIVLLIIINIILKQEMYQLFTIFFFGLSGKQFARYKNEKLKSALLFTIGYLLIAIGNGYIYISSILK